jgi:hypothetical protein
MSAITSLRTAVGTLSGAPVVVLGGLVYASVLLPQRALQLAALPFLPTLLQLVTFFVTPFVLAGVIGMARDALDGSGSLDALIETGTDRYLDLLLGTLVELGIQLTFGVVFVVLALIVGVSGVSGGVGPATLVGGGVLVLAVLAYLTVLFVIQFYPIAVVVDDAGPVDGVTRSVSFVRGNVLSTLGYSVVTVVVGGLASLPVSGLVAYRFLAGDVGPAGSGGGMGPGPGSGTEPLGGMGTGSGAGTGPGTVVDILAGGPGPALGTPEIVAVSLLGVVTTGVFFAFRQTYATAFYRRRGRTVEERVLDEGS